MTSDQMTRDQSGQRIEDVEKEERRLKIRSRILISTPFSASFGPDW
jgi:hypothetical protein